MAEELGYEILDFKRLSPEERERQLKKLEQLAESLKGLDEYFREARRIPPELWQRELRHAA